MQGFVPSKPQPIKTNNDSNETICFLFSKSSLFQPCPRKPEINRNPLKLLFQKDGEIDLRLLIHQSLAGCVIGKGGSKIKEIRDVSSRILNFDTVENVENEKLKIIVATIFSSERKRQAKSEQCARSIQT